MILKSYKRPPAPEVHFELRDSTFGVHLVQVNAGGRILAHVLALKQHQGKIAMHKKGGLNKRLFWVDTSGRLLDIDRVLVSVGKPEPSSSKPKPKEEEEKKGKENGTT